MFLDAEDKYTQVFRALVPDAAIITEPPAQVDAWRFIRRRDVGDVMAEHAAAAQSGPSLLHDPLIDELCSKEGPLRELSQRLAASQRALHVWTLVLKNIIEHPLDAKYRRLRVGTSSFVSMCSVEPVPPELQRHPDPAMVSPAAAANCHRVHVVLCDVLGFNTEAPPLAATQQQFVSLPMTARLSELEEALSVVLLRQRLVEEQEALLHDALGTIDTCRVRQAKHEERVAVASRFAEASSAGGIAQTLDFLRSDRAEVARVCASSAFDHADCWFTIRDALAWLREERRPNAVEAWSSPKPLPRPSADAVAAFLTRVAQRPVSTRGTVASAMGVADEVRAVEPASSVQAYVSWQQRGEPSSLLDVNAAQALLSSVDTLVAEALQECDSVRLRLEKERKAAIKTQATAALVQEATAKRSVMSERDKEIQAVATNLIGDIAALMEHHWRLEGEVGYVAHHRVEAKRLHALLAEGRISIDELHALVGEWTEKVAEVKRKLNLPVA